MSLSSWISVLIVAGILGYALTFLRSCLIISLGKSGLICKRKIGSAENHNTEEEQSFYAPSSGHIIGVLVKIMIHEHVFLLHLCPECEFIYVQCTTSFKTDWRLGSTQFVISKEEIILEKNSVLTQLWWYVPISPVTQKAEARRLQVQGQQGKFVRPCLRNKKYKVLGL